MTTEQDYALPGQNNGGDNIQKYQEVAPKNVTSEQRRGLQDAQRMEGVTQGCKFNCLQKKCTLGFPN